MLSFLKSFVFRFVSLTIAVAVVPLAVARIINVFLVIALAFSVALIWSITFAVGLERYGRRAAWLLLLAPIGLFWPAFAVYWFYRAGQGDPNWIFP